MKRYKSLKKKAVDFYTHCLMDVTANSFPVQMFFPAPQGMV